MTITFGCPHCGNLCAFDVQHAGRRARCTTCQKRFIIPKRPGEKVEKAADEAGQIEAGAFSGFYRAVLCESWRALVRPSSSAPLLFVAFVVALRFFMGHPANKMYILIMPVFFGWVVTILTWATVLWYCTEIVYTTGFGEKSLPVIRIGLLPVFVVKVLGAIYTLFIMFVVIEGPFLVVMYILRSKGVESAAAYYLIGAAGFFAMPMAFVILSVGKDVFMVLRIDQIVGAIARSLGPYMVVFGFAIAAAGVQFFIVQYARKASWVLWQSGAWLACNVLAAYFAMIAARVAGLFYRHYGCYLPC